MLVNGGRKMKWNYWSKRKGEYEYEIHLKFSTKIQRDAWVSLIDKCMLLMLEMEEE